jgi:hypothetical protein
VVVLATLLAVEWYVYWSGTHIGSFFRCIYGDPSCSLTLATWLLAVVTVLILLAAFKAANEAVKAYIDGQKSLATAQRTLNFERLALLAERTCSREGHNDSPEIEWWIADDLLNRYLTPPPGKEFQKPPRRHDFFNLGRAALINPIIGIQISSADGTPRQYNLELPCIPTDSDVHVTFHIEVGIGQIAMQFNEGTKDEQLASLIQKMTDDDQIDPTKLHFFSQRRSESSAAMVSLTDIKSSQAGTSEVGGVVPAQPQLENEE